MNRAALIEQIHEKKSFLCVGLDPDLKKIPACLQREEDPIFAFNKAIIDATIPYAVAYKPNTAFYECYGIEGMKALKKTIDYLKQFPVFNIADAKRGDIGNTSTQYAKAFLADQGDFGFDAITVAPYMGEDSVAPFLAFEGKWAVILGLTSNKGSADFQFLKPDHRFLFEHVLEKASQWGTPQNTMFVIGATQADRFQLVRNILPEHFLLVPGIGAQGGDLASVCKYGLLKNDIGLLINSSRSILYASNGTDFAQKAAEEAHCLQNEMSQYV